MFKPMERAMLRILLPFFAALAACTPSPQEDAMRSLDPISRDHTEGSSETRLEGLNPAVTSPPDQPAKEREHAVKQPIPERVSVAVNAASTNAKNVVGEAEGRRILSTAFVRMGPDGHLTVELRDGQVLVLRDVALRPGDYCGVQVLGGPPRTRYCGGYADIIAARPGGAPAPEKPNVGISIR